ncbi:MAG TPA: EutN/CcmL family microcompartment protein [Pirellulales bacterium]|nr:EutN/CcmL family microcompartment protein [Pirellulales bacterium]
MRIGTIIGCVTLSRWHSSLGGATYKLAVPLTHEALQRGDAPAGEELVVYDELGAGLGERIAISEGGEAAQPFEPELKPIDAYNAAILDQINLSTR